MSIPNSDLRETHGEPEVQTPPPQPKRKTDGWRIATRTFQIAYVAFLVLLCILILYLFGPLIGLGIILFGGVARLKHRSPR